MNNKIAMSTLRGVSVEDSLQFAVNCGFDGIEIQTDYLPEKVKEQNSIIKKAKELGLDVSLHSPCGDINISSLNSGIKEESVLQVKKAIDLAKKFDLRVVTVHPGRLSSARENVEEKWKVLIDSVNEIASYAKKKEVYVALENMELRKKEIVLTTNDLSRFEQIAKDNKFFGVTIDISHFATNKIYPDGIKGIPLPVYNVHISQCVDGKPHYPFTYDGEINICDIKDFLKNINYNSTVVLELKSIFDAEIYIKSRETLCR